MVHGADLFSSGDHAKAKYVVYLSLSSLKLCTPYGKIVGLPEKGGRQWLDAGGSR